MFPGRLPFTAAGAPEVPDGGRDGLPPWSRSSVSVSPLIGGLCGVAVRPELPLHAPQATGDGRPRGRAHGDDERGKALVLARHRGRGEDPRASGAASPRGFAMAVAGQ
jgi:hypothetical protein